MSSGMLGGLPLTSVIVRSSANANAGGKTKQSSMLHGVWLLLALLIIPSIINMIPLACLAAILLVTGYKLAKIPLFTRMYKRGLDQFIPFVVTILAVVFTDLLKGVGIGMVVAIFYILRNNMRNPFGYDLEESNGNKKIKVYLSEEVSFLNKAAIQQSLYNLPKDVTHIIVDGTNSRFIDKDVVEVIKDFEQNAISSGKRVELIDVYNKREAPNIHHLFKKTQPRTRKKKSKLIKQI
jgi:MFS superfamily sulfate permease-like transporter